MESKKQYRKEVSDEDYDYDREDMTIERVGETLDAYEVYQCLIYSKKKLKYCRIKTKGGTKLLKIERKVLLNHRLQNVHQIHLFLKASTLRKTARRAPQTYHQKVSLLKSEGKELLSLSQNVKVEASRGINGETGILKPCVILK